MSYLHTSKKILSRIGAGEWESFNWYGDRDLLIASANYFQKHGVVKIRDAIVLNEWLQFIELVGSRKGIVVVMVALPPHWPRPAGIHVVEDHWFIFDVINGCITRAKKNMIYQRQIQADQPRFVHFSGWEFDRAIFVQWLRAVGLDLGNTLYHAASERLQFDPDLFDINADLTASPARLLKPHHRYDAARNFEVLAPVIRSADFELILPNRCLQDSAFLLTEKDVLSTLSGVPGVVVENPGRRRWCESLGFERYCMDFQHSGQALYHSVIQWLCYYQQFTLPQRQRWQDKQGERVYRNFANLDRIMSGLLERSQAQVDGAAGIST